jgi:hypothetical protein
MNLRARHLPLVLLGTAIGAGIGWVVSLILPNGVLPEFEKAIGFERTWEVIGGLVGAALTVLLLLVRSVRDPKAEPSRNITRINGIGSMLIGRRDVAPDRSYQTTEWFVVFFLPVFPVCEYRVTARGRGAYVIHSKGAPRMSEVVKVYLAELAAGGFLLAAVFLQSLLIALVGLVSVIIFTTFLWIRERKEARAHGVVYSRNFCRKCGYRLTGNASGVCPECGTSTPA